jgi:hypothetical protein
MAIHFSKAFFFAEGIEACNMPYDKPDCPICRERLQSNTLVLYKAPTPQSKTATVTADTTHTVFTPASANNTEATGSKNAITVNEDEAVGIMRITRPSICPAATISSAATVSRAGSTPSLRARTVALSSSPRQAWDQNSG